MVENTDVSRTQVMCHIICIFFDLLKVEQNLCIWTMLQNFLQSDVLHIYFMVPKIILIWETCIFTDKSVSEFHFLGTHSVFYIKHYSLLQYDWEHNFFPKELHSIAVQRIIVWFRLQKIIQQEGCVSTLVPRLL